MGLVWWKFILLITEKNEIPSHIVYMIKPFDLLMYFHGHCFFVLFLQIYIFSLYSFIQLINVKAKFIIHVHICTDNTIHTYTYCLFVDSIIMKNKIIISVYWPPGSNKQTNKKVTEPNTKKRKGKKFNNKRYQIMQKQQP